MARVCLGIPSCPPGPSRAQNLERCKIPKNPKSVIPFVANLPRQFISSLSSSIRGVSVSSSCSRLLSGTFVALSLFPTTPFLGTGRRRCSSQVPWRHHFSFLKQHESQSRASSGCDESESESSMSFRAGYSSRRREVSRGTLDRAIPASSLLGRRRNGGSGRDVAWDRRLYSLHGLNGLNGLNSSRHRHTPATRSSS